MIALRREYLYSFLFMAGALCCFYELSNKEYSSNNYEILNTNIIDSSLEKANFDSEVKNSLINNNKISNSISIEYYHKIVVPTQKNLKKLFSDLNISWLDVALKKSAKINIHKNDRMFLSLKKQGNNESLCDVKYYTHDGYCIFVNINKKSIVRKKAKRTLKRISGYSNKSFVHAIKSYNVPKQIIRDSVNGMQSILNINKSNNKKQNFEILYSVIQMPNGDNLSPKFIYASVGDKHKVYYLQDKGYFNDQGKYLGKNILKNPLRTKACKLSSGFGIRKDPFTFCSKMHYGVDYSAASGTPVYSVSKGRVVKALYEHGFGNTVEIIHDNKSFVSKYAHLRKICVKVGQIVTEDTKIGEVGRTGKASGDHLHFEIHKCGMKVNPLKIRDFGSKDLYGSYLSDFNRYKKSINIQIASTAPEIPVKVG